MEYRTLRFSQDVVQQGVTLKSTRELQYTQQKQTITQRLTLEFTKH